jgi:hypothetical protein
LAEWPYLQELEYQCRLAIAAADGMRASTDRFWENSDLPPAQPVIADFFDHAHRFFSSAGIIAKILYADQPNAKAQDKAGRSRWLRGLLGLDDDSPLADATVRNANEHIDERIDRWTMRHPDAWRHAGHGISRAGPAPQQRPPTHRTDSTADTPTYWVTSITPVVAEPEARAHRPDSKRPGGHGMSQRSTRHYDSTTDTLWIWGEDPVVVGPVITAVRDLQAQVAAFRQRLFVTKS